MSTFSLQKPTGEGGNGMVFLAADSTGSVIAVKAFKGTDKLTRAKREESVGMSLQHPNLGKCIRLDTETVVVPQLDD